MNGQTLTSGVQVDLSELKNIDFDQNKKEVKVEAGVSWDTMLKKINFPQYCPPVFSNNPGQEIHVAGQVAVGGIGFYSSKYGGLWNWVKEITLVTMEGNVITCSRNQNADLFKYSLGGFGRVGVISEVVLEVKESKEKVLPFELLYVKHENYLDDITKMAKSDYFDGVIYMHAHASVKSFDSGIPLHAIIAFVEPDENIGLNEIEEHIGSNYHSGLAHFSQWSQNESRIRVSGKNIKKEDIVYYYPNSEDFNTYQKCHPWNDYTLPPEKVPDFYELAEDILGSKELSKFSIKHTFADDLFKLDGDIIGYGIRNLGMNDGFDYPLCLDLPNVPEAIHLGSSLAVPPSKLDKATAAIDKLTDVVYEMGGERYLYGYHSLTKDQVVKHYGSSTLDKWQNLKDKHDPKHLLNREVIEHLD
jgi:FAD/FMN-containing dehydrogenase